MGRGCSDAPACFGSARDCGLGRPEQQKRPARLARGEAEALAFLEIERLRDEAGDDPRRTRAQDLFDRPESIPLLARLDESEAPGIEAERLESMAMKPARELEAWHRGDDEDGPAFGKRHHERGQETESRRHIEAGSGMDLMDAVERQALAGKVLVDGRKPEGKEPARTSMGRRCRHQPAQILKVREAGMPRLTGRETDLRGKKHEKIYRT